VIVHAGLIALHHQGRWKGVLIEGPSGAGKSDLALRALGRGFRLVADDRVKLWTSQDQLYGAAPKTLSGLIEARGLGVLAAPTRPFARISMIVQCIQMDGAIERTPDPAVRVHMGQALPLICLRPLEASALDKLVRALSLLGEQA
jgi:serine kinase of HPr protein (carbohydrate metabolism regulator)